MHFEFFGDESLENIPSKVEMTVAPAIDHTKQTEDALELDELRTKEDRLNQLAIEDPVEFERQLANGELTKDDEPEDGDDE